MDNILNYFFNAMEKRAAGIGSILMNSMMPIMAIDEMRTKIKQEKQDIPYKSVNKLTNQELKLQPSTAYRRPYSSQNISDTISPYAQ
jgi:hypothetical protein